MAKLQALLIISIALLISPVLCGHRRLRDIQEVCDETDGLREFGRFLRANPDIYHLFAVQRNDTIYLPTDRAFRDYLACNGGVFRRAGASSAQALQSSAKGAAAISAAKSAGKKRSAGGVGLVQETLNTESSPDGNTSTALVFKPGDGPTGVSLASGTCSVDVIIPDLWCIQGIIHGVNGVPTIPVPVAETLTNTNQTKFLGFINDACLQDSFNNMNQITLFSPTDSALENSTTLDIGNHFISGDAFYSTHFIDGNVLQADNGGYLYISNKNGQVLINCIPIVATDILSNNGAIHTIDGIFTTLHAPPVCP